MSAEDPEPQESPDFADPEGRGKLCPYCGEHMSYDQHICPECKKSVF